MLQTAKKLGPGKTVVTMLCDSGMVGRAARGSLAPLRESRARWWTKPTNQPTNAAAGLAFLPFAPLLLASSRILSFPQRYATRLFNREWVESKGLLDSIPKDYQRSLQ